MFKMLYKGEDILNKKTCCFFGHRNIEITQKTEKVLFDVVKLLIIQKGITRFLFGSKSQFNDLCYKIVSLLQKEFPFVQKIYVRAEYPYPGDEYIRYLLEMYEGTYYPDKIKNAGRAVYVERNFEMIDKSEYCIVYFDKNYTPFQHKKRSASGTGIAYNYAVRKQKEVINIFDMCF